MYWHPLTDLLVDRALARKRPGSTRPKRRRLRALMIALALSCGLPALGSASALAASPSLSLTKADSEPAEGRAAPSAKRLAELREKVAAEPGSREARFDLVKALMAANDLSGALEAAKAWRVKDAYNLVVVRLIGDIHTELGDLPNARRAYSAVVELLPEDPGAHRALATVLKQGGELEGAYTRLLAASKLREDDVRIAFELADVAHRLDRAAEATTRFEAIAANDKASDGIRYPAKQRLAQLYSASRREALAAGHTAAADTLLAKIKALELKGGAVNDIKVYLSWDTDRSDVDLWVINPAGEKIFYSHRNGRFGGALFHDVTTGYGPESFTAREAHPGTWLVQVNYFSTNRRRFTEARGEVVVVLHEGTAKEQRHVLPYRLFKAKQTVTVARIKAQAAAAGPTRTSERSAR